jgi:SAM-dependent methyltransferase
MVARTPDFAGATASSYARYRRDVPETLIEAAVVATGLSTDDVALDLGCGTGQVAVPLARRARLVLAVDPEPDMLAELRRRLDTAAITNVLPVLGADRHLRWLAGSCGGPLAMITVANALHWMDAVDVFEQSGEVLRHGGGLVVFSQGPPMWLADAPWSRALRRFLEDWTGGAVNATCGTDRATLELRERRLRGCGFEHVAVVEHAYENPIDLDYVIGHLGSAMSESAVPDSRRQAFEQRLHAALGTYLAAGELTERIDATALIAIL